MVKLAGSVAPQSMAKTKRTRKRKADSAAATHPAPLAPAQPNSVAGTPLRIPYGNKEVALADVKRADAILIGHGHSKTSMESEKPRDFRRDTPARVTVGVAIGGAVDAFWRQGAGVMGPIVLGQLSA
jgi:hypothetical protein